MGFDLIPGSLDDKGALIPTNAEARYRTSPLLEVDASQSYTAQIFITLSSIYQRAWMSLNWFDSNQQFISRDSFEENPISSVGYYNYRHTVQSPSNAKFVRLSIRSYTDGTLKLEQGSVATPWMPSASEVKPSDQPKYIGTYTDKNESDSLDPTKYTWKLNPEYNV